MQLINDMGIGDVNAETIRKTLLEYPGNHVVRLTREVGMAQLVWQNGEEKLHRSVHVSIPIAWLEDISRREYLEAAARSVALGILAERTSLGLVNRERDQ